jgi:hypothetical protein
MDNTENELHEVGYVVDHYDFGGDLSQQEKEYEEEHVKSEVKSAIRNTYGGSQHNAELYIAPSELEIEIIPTYDVAEVEITDLGSIYASCKEGETNLCRRHGNFGDDVAPEGATENNFGIR